MDFIDNKYHRIYKCLCARALGRILPRGTYTERHHIIPRSLGGPDQHENLVDLTAKEHYIAHMCLVRCTQGQAQQKMRMAVLAFRRTNRKQLAEYVHLRLTSRIFSLLREEAAAEQSRERKGDTRYGFWKNKTLPAETKAKISASMRGVKKSPTHVQRQSESHRGTKHRAWSVEARERHRMCQRDAWARRKAKLLNTP